MSEKKTIRGSQISARDLRLYTGLVIAVFITSHLINHALGLISINAMENYRKAHGAIWQSPPGVVALYGSIIIHFLLLNSYCYFEILELTYQFFSNDH